MRRVLLQLHPFSFFPHKLSLLFVVFVLFVAVFHKFIPFLVYIKLSLIFVVFVLFVAVFLYSTMVKSLRPFLEEATSLVLFCHLLGFSDPTGLPSPKKKVGPTSGIVRDMTTPLLSTNHPLRYRTKACAVFFSSVN